MKYHLLLLCHEVCHRRVHDFSSTNDELKNAVKFLLAKNIFFSSSFVDEKECILWDLHTSRK